MRQNRVIVVAYGRKYLTATKTSLSILPERGIAARLSERGIAARLSERGIAARLSERGIAARRGKDGRAGYTLGRFFSPSFNALLHQARSHARSCEPARTE